MERAILATPMDQVVAGKSMQQMHTEYATAVSVQQPRNLDKIIKAVMVEAQHAGENFYYGWGEGKDRIEGESVGLALCVAREWGNCAVDTKLEETPEAYLFTGIFIDLERGFTITRKYRQSKNHKVYGKMDEERKADIRFQIGQSKAIRNVVQAAVPKWLMKDAREAAKKAVVDGITHEGLKAAIEKSFSFLKRHGVDEERILAKMGKTAAELTAEDIADIRTACAAINNGEATTEECFPKVEPKVTKSPDKEPVKGKAETPSPAKNEPSPIPEAHPDKIFIFKAEIDLCETAQAVDQWRSKHNKRVDREFKDDDASFTAVMSYANDRYEALSQNASKLSVEV